MALKIIRQNALNNKQLWIMLLEKLKLNLYFKSHIKINSTWIKDLKVKQKIFKFLEQVRKGIVINFG